jgi:hypothetical protein
MVFCLIAAAAAVVELLSYQLLVLLAVQVLVELLSLQLLVAIVALAAA